MTGSVLPLHLSISVPLLIGIYQKQRVNLATLMHPHRCPTNFIARSVTESTFVLMLV